MSTAVMSNPMFEYSELLFKNTTKSKDPALITTTTNCNNINVNTSVSTNVTYSNVSTCNKNASNTNNSNSNNNTSSSNNNNNNNNNNNSNNSSSNGHAPLRRSYTSLVTTLIEQHRKLDRSVSEPTSRYKTELCRPFEESGACKYGDKCQFAHGNSELRNLARHPKYKTELCRTFHTIGFCPYGPRCHFIHNFEEAPIHIQKVCAQLVTTTQPLNIMGLNPLLSAAAAAAASRCNNATSQTNQVANNTTSGNLNVSLLEQIAAAPQMVAAAAAAAAAASTTAAAPTAATPNLMRTNSLNLGTNNNSVAAVTSGPTAVAASAAGTYNNSPPPLLRTNSLSLASAAATSAPHHHAQQQQHHHHHHLANTSAAISVIGGTRPKPLNLSPTFSLGSTGDSISPSSSLSQSPTNSMASFFSDDCLSQQQQPATATAGPLPTTASPFGFGQDFGLLAPRQTPSPQAMAACSVVATAAAAGRWRDPCQWSSEDVVTSRTPSPLSPNAESRLPVFNWISNTLSDFDNLKI